jgi:hypothetical protein
VKRAAEFRQLSEDHYHGLVQVKRLRRISGEADDGSAEIARASWSLGKRRLPREGPGDDIGIRKITGRRSTA